GPVTLPPAHPVLDGDADHVDDALQGVAGDPGPERHGRVLATAEHEHDGGDGDESEVPEQVERHDGAGVGPVRLPLLEVLRGRLPHQHRRLPHRPPPPAPQQPRRAAERRPAERAPRRRPPPPPPPPPSRGAESRSASPRVLGERGVAIEGTPCGRSRRRETLL
ncbi:hypothetical protein EE612_025004, partial [Oryza sativa]